MFFQRKTNFILCIVVKYCRNDIISIYICKDIYKYQMYILQNRFQQKIQICLRKVQLVRDSIRCIIQDAVHKNASIISFHHYLQWTASPTADMYADAVMKVILKAQDLDNSSVSVPTNMNPTFDKMHFKVSDQENVFLYRLEYY